MLIMTVLFDGSTDTDGDGGILISADKIIVELGTNNSQEIRLEMENETLF